MKYSFARANAYSSGYRPRSYTPGRYAHFCPGELISGYVEATFSPYLSANFIAWDRLDIEWAKTFRSWYLPGPWQIVLKPETVAKIPLLGGENLYAPQNPLIANSARLGTPELDLYTWRLRAKVAHTPRHSRHLWSANNTLIKENIPENEEAPKENRAPALIGLDMLTINPLNGVVAEMNAHLSIPRDALWPEKIFELLFAI